MKIKELEQFLSAKGMPKFRLNQIIKAIYQDSILSFQEMSTLPKDLRAEMDKTIKILSFEPVKVLISDDQASAKVLFKTPDNLNFESVIMKNKADRWTVCLSSQIGCPIGCPFCATGKNGFKRNLTSEEITDQVLFWQNYLKINSPKTKLDSIVFMGMGEPFLNWENVKQAIKKITDPGLFGFGNRNISVSTIGIIEGIKKIAKEFPQINLAVSLHAASDKKRNMLVPINEQHNLKKLRQAIDLYIEQTNRKVFFEYTMLENVNDSQHDAVELGEYVKSFAKPYLILVNLIPYNETSKNFSPTSSREIEKFKNELMRNKVQATVRKSLGKEIEGACGQLAGKQLK
jgi:23S rRNA (adenine(2503)-C(2))-methyltransferase